MVRIHFPPAESPSLSPSCFRGSRSPAFRAAVRGMRGDRVGKDAQRVSRSRQSAAISLSRRIPVPQRRRWGRRECYAGPHRSGRSPGLIMRWIAGLGPRSTKAQHDPLIVPGKRPIGNLTTPFGGLGPSAYR